MLAKLPQFAFYLFISILLSDPYGACIEKKCYNGGECQKNGKVGICLCKYGFYGEDCRLCKYLLLYFIFVLCSITMPITGNICVHAEMLKLNSLI